MTAQLSASLSKTGCFQVEDRSPGTELRTPAFRQAEKKSPLLTLLSFMWTRSTDLSENSAETMLTITRGSCILEAVCLKCDSDLRVWRVSCFMRPLRDLCFALHRARSLCQLAGHSSSLRACGIQNPSRASAGKGAHKAGLVACVNKRLFFHLCVRGSHFPRHWFFRLGGGGFFSQGVICLFGYLTYSCYI